MTNVQSIYQANGATYIAGSDKQGDVSFKYDDTEQKNDSIFLGDDEICQEPINLKGNDTDIETAEFNYGEAVKLDENKKENNLIDKFLTATNPVYVTCDAISENRGVSETIVDIFKSAAGSLNPVYGVYRFLTSD